MLQRKYCFTVLEKGENILYERTHGEQNHANFEIAKNWIENEWTESAEEFYNIFNTDDTETDKAKG